MFLLLAARTKAVCPICMPVAKLVIQLLQASGKATWIDISNDEPFNAIRTLVEMVRYNVERLNEDDRM